MKYPRIHHAKAIDDTTPVIEFTNQEVKKYDVRHLLYTSMFSPLRQPAFFKNFKVEPGGYEIVWNQEIDLSCLGIFYQTNFTIYGNAIALKAMSDRWRNLCCELSLTVYPEQIPK